MCVFFFLTVCVCGGVLQFLQPEKITPRELSKQASNTVHNVFIQEAKISFFDQYFHVLVSCQNYIKATESWEQCSVKDMLDLV